MMCARGLVMIGSPASVFLLLLGLVGCGAPAEPDSPRLKITSDIQSNPESPFFLPLAEYPVKRNSLPIGVFDSGTGGLTVLDAILKLDRFRNRTLEASPDQLPDFAGEEFVYLADSANMPYGRYAAEGKVDLLREHILKDARFLLDRKYAVNPGDQAATGKKNPAKVIVIACNTATAYGLEDLRRALSDWRLDVGVIGVIDAGAVTAIDGLEGDGKGYVIGVMATEGTCASGGYPKAVRERFKNRFNHQDLHVVQQAGLGIAGAVDGDLSYIDPAATAPRGVGPYQGPGLGHATSPVDPTLWRDYHFDTTENHLLVEKGPQGRILRVELNSVENYIRYHVTTLMRQALERSPDRKLACVILGCTHYPFFADDFRAHFRYLRGVSGEYGQLIPDDMVFVDPARSTAIQLYQHLARRGLLATREQSLCQFYVSVPNPRLPQNQILGKAGFSYTYKYGRQANQDLQYVRRVPFSREWIPPGNVQRIRESMPEIYLMMCRFHTLESFRNYPPDVLFR